MWHREKVCSSDFKVNANTVVCPLIKAGNMLNNINKQGQAIAWFKREGPPIRAKPSFSFSELLATLTSCPWLESQFCTDSTERKESWTQSSGFYGYNLEIISTFQKFVPRVSLDIVNLTWILWCWNNKQYRRCIIYQYKPWCVCESPPVFLVYNHL